MRHGVPLLVRAALLSSGALLLATAVEACSGSAGTGLALSEDDAGSDASMTMGDDGSKDASAGGDAGARDGGHHGAADAGGTDGAAFDAAPADDAALADGAPGDGATADASSADGFPVDEASTDGGLDGASAEGSSGEAGSASNTFYVATDGDDSHDGSIGSPWKTISHAMNTVAAGATVMVRAGVYGEAVSVGVSGTAGSPITLESFTGETAIVDGTGVTFANGSALIAIDSQSDLVVRGLEIRNGTGDGSDAIAGILVSGTSSGVQIVGNHVHDIGAAMETVGGAIGIAVMGDTATPISDIVIQDNEVDDVTAGLGNGLWIAGNVDGFTVQGNTIHDVDSNGIDVTSYQGIGPSAASDVARDGTIAQNTIHDLTTATNAAYGAAGSASGVDLDGAKDILVERNEIYDADYGVTLASAHSGRATSYVLVRNNLLYYANVAGLAVGGYDASVGGADHCAALNDTLYDNTTELVLGAHVSSFLYEDNLVFDVAASYEAGATTGATIDTDLDLDTGADALFVSAGSPPDGTVPVNLQVAAASLSEVEDKGVEVGCPAAWVCPAVWGGSWLNGSVDFAGSPRTDDSGVDIGAYQSQ